MRRVFNKKLFKAWLKNEGRKGKLKIALHSDISIALVEKLAAKKDRPMVKIDVGQKMANTMGVSFDELFPIVYDEVA